MVLALLECCLPVKLQTGRAAWFALSSLRRYRWIRGRLTALGPLQLRALLGRWGQNLVLWKKPLRSIIRVHAFRWTSLLVSPRVSAAPLSVDGLASTMTPALERCIPLVVHPMWLWQSRLSRVVSLRGSWVVMPHSLILIRCPGI